MKKCSSCGYINDDDSAFCGQCGNRLDTQSAVEPAAQPYTEPATQPISSPTPDAATPQLDADAILETIGGVADKTARGAKDLADKINVTVSTTIKNEKAKAAEAAQKEIDRAQRADGNKKTTIPQGSTAYMSTTELWSVLQKSSKRQHFFTEEENTLTQEEYVRLLDQKLEGNNVPAHIESRNIKWDRSDMSQKIHLILPVSDAVNPLSCLVQFNHVGKFTFVEEKTFITPPDLPEVPKKKVPIPDELKQHALLAPLGALVAACGLALAMMAPPVGLVILLVGAAFAWYGFRAWQKLKALREHNTNCDRQELAWNRAWDNWESSIFLHSFQEHVNGQISRIYDAAFECIKQLNGELFSQKVDEDEESSSLNELEQLIKRRKDSYR